jgi:hypothetical protein
VTVGFVIKHYHRYLLEGGRLNDFGDSETNLATAVIAGLVYAAPKIGVRSQNEYSAEKWITKYAFRLTRNVQISIPRSFAYINNYCRING